MTMDILIPKPGPDAPRTMIRRAGYAEFRDPVTGETSYVRRLSHAGFYPRFHVYIKDRPEAVIFSLHLDQKKPSYEGAHAHSGEYDGPVVESEAGRIRQSFERMKSGGSENEKNEKSKKGFWANFF